MLGVCLYPQLPSIQSACPILQRHLQPARLYHVFFSHYVTNGTILGKTLLNIKCVFWFFYTNSVSKFLILIITQRDIIINVHRSSCKVPFLVNDERDAQILFYVLISIYNSLHVSITSCLSSGETNCINTAAGNSHSMLVVEMCAGWKKSLILTCTHLGHQHRMTVTRVCIDKICLS